ncbi:hypothetical protein PN459_21530 [Microcystis aeruginosa CS-567/02-A1]|uniref:hypothetical protein n=1 Tax=Microcystis aeruginosa TaxID=1126 RepID=UPI00232FE317|nr:hypothetical protein [Microcystis aeruginosa]MDB9402537.1 hypothetical protein [Microcystis aeruginosa CS-567/02-A1]
MPKTMPNQSPLETQLLDMGFRFDGAGEPLDFGLLDPDMTIDDVYIWVLFDEIVVGINTRFYSSHSADINKITNLVGA